MTILYFSATGNSLFTAKKIGGNLLSIPQLVREKKYDIEDDVIGIVCPTYCADAPRMVQEYLNQARLKADYTFFISTYGYNAGAVT
ncbi:MAG: 4Fe-4S ferredoxin, partial [Eubacterium sp.]